MRISWKQMNPHFADKVRLSLASKQRAAPKPDSLAGSIVWSLLTLAVSALLVLAYVDISFHLTGPRETLALLMVPFVLMSLVRVWNQPPDTYHRWFVPHRLVREAFNEVATTRAERLYADIMILLAEMQLPRGVNVGAMLLGQSNLLLTSSQELEMQARRLHSLLPDGVSLATLEAEQDTIRHQLAHAEDTQVRYTLAESLGLSIERAENLRAMAQSEARIAAHQESVCQALALMQSALMREQSAAALLNVNRGLPDGTSLRDTVREVTNRARALEELGDARHEVTVRTR